MTKSNYKLTKEDFKQINRRSLFTFQLGWNYERMQGSGYLYTILPQLRKIYGDNTPELIQSLLGLILQWKKKRELLQRKPYRG